VVTPRELLAFARLAGLTVTVNPETGNLRIAGPPSAEPIAAEIRARRAELAPCQWCGEPAGIPGDGCPPICGLCDAVYPAGACLACGARNVARNAGGYCRACARLQRRPASQI
jgi:hypothetical protein